MDGPINAYVERLRLQGVEGWGEASVWKRWRCSSSHLGVQIADFKMRMLQKTGHAVFRLIQSSVRHMRAEIKKAGEKEKKDKK